MKPYNITLINGIVLVIMGLWGYLITFSPTAGIAPVMGALFLACTDKFKAGNQMVIHIVVLLTLILTISLFVPLKSEILERDSLGTFRVSLMFLSGLLACFVYVKSFIDNRKNRLE